MTLAPFSSVHRTLSAFTAPLKAGKALVAFAATFLTAYVDTAMAATQDEIAKMPGITAWYRADAAKQDANHNLTSWPDSSSSAKVITPAGQAPTLVANAINGQPAVHFDGKQGALIEKDTNWSKAAFTVFIVASVSSYDPKPEAAYQSIGQAFVSDGGGGGLSLGLNWNNRPGIALGIPMDDLQVFGAKEPPYVNFQASDIVVDPKKFYVYSYASEKGRTQATGQDCHTDLDIQVNDLANTSVLNILFNVQDYGHLGDTKLQIGAGNGHGALNGDIAEILIFSSKLLQADSAKVRSYLSQKYAVSTPVEFYQTTPVTIYPRGPLSPIWFKDSTSVWMESATAGSTIFYTTDGSEPTEKSNKYAGPFTINKKTTIKAAAFAEHRKPSETTWVSYWPVSEIAAASRDSVQGGWEFSWGDEFNGPEIDKKLWGQELNIRRNVELQAYTDRPDNAFIKDGVLVIRSQKEKFAGQQDGQTYTGASISTENNKTLTFGRYEMRTKVDPSPGSWPGWWMFARPLPGRTWPADGEIDMMEYYMGKYNSNVMDGKGNFNTVRKKLHDLGPERWPKEFHVWGMDWTKEYIDLYLDGELVNHYPTKNADGTGPNGSNPFLHPENLKILFNEAVGGLWGGPAIKDVYDMEVDWTRVYTWSDAKAYTLTVNNGAGSGPYIPGKPVGITAGILAHAPEQKFERWATNDPRAVIDNPTSPTALLTMPEENITVTAIYSATEEKAKP